MEMIKVPVKMSYCPQTGEKEFEYVEMPAEEFGDLMLRILLPRYNLSLNEEGL